LKEIKKFLDGFFKELKEAVDSLKEFDENAGINASEVHLKEREGLVTAVNKQMKKSFHKI
jgi:hypothetical protein